MTAPTMVRSPNAEGYTPVRHTLEECRSELAEVLEDWLLLRIHKNLGIPKIDGLELTVTKEVCPA